MTQTGQNITADKGQQRIDSVEILRGLASLAVAWFHLTNTHDWNWVRYSGDFGWMGVEVFFVISGFVIPLSIHQRYGMLRPVDFAPYMARRLFRLEPPYLLSVVMAVVLWELSALAPGFAGGDPQWSIGQVLAHVAYVIPITSFGWLNIVYWTLAFEFVFYLAAGSLYFILGFPGLRRWPAAVAIILALCIAGLLSPFVLLFVFGIAVFRYLFLKEDLWVTLSTLALGAATMIIVDRPEEAIAGTLTAVIIMATSKMTFRATYWKPFFALSALSYSLYLVHVPIGGRFVNLFRQFTPDAAWADLFLWLGALAISLAAAYVLWRWVEQPSIMLARRIGSRLEERNRRRDLVRSGVPS